MPPWPPRQAAFPAWADTPPIRRARVMFKFLELLNQHRDELAHADHRRARQGLHRRAGRGHARHRHRRVRLRHPAAAQGRLHRPGLHRHRQLDAAPAAGRGGRHHALQLPGDGADVDVPGGDRGRQHASSSSPARRDPSASLLMAELLKEAGLPDGVFNVVQGDKDSGRRAARASRRQGHQLRRLDADRQLHLRDRRAPRQARAGAGRREEPHGRDARRRHRPDGRRADRRGLRLGRRALHGDHVAVLVGDAADKIMPKLIERAKTLKVLERR